MWSWSILTHKHTGMHPNANPFLFLCTHDTTHTCTAHPPTHHTHIMTLHNSSASFTIMLCALYVQQVQQSMDWVLYNS